MALVISKKTSACALLEKEDDDDLYRSSSKKSKNGVGGCHEEDWPKLESAHMSPWQQGQSFAEKLKGIRGNGETMSNAVQGGSLTEDMLTDKDQADTDDDDECQMGGHGVKSGIQGDEVGTDENKKDTIVGNIVGASEPPSQSSNDIWKVVHKPHRQRRGGKEKHDETRQLDSGSRFGILAEDGGTIGSGGVFEAVPVVQFGAEAKKDDSTRMTTGSSPKGKKSTTKSKLNKKQSVLAQSGSQVHNRHDQRKEKRSRDGVQNVKENGEDLSSTFVMSKGEENKGQNLLENKNEEVVQGVLQNVENRDTPVVLPVQGFDQFSMVPHDPGDSRKLGGLQGKFWSGPSEVGRDLEMEDDPSLGSVTFMDSIFYWNSRGACGSNLLRQIKTGFKCRNPSILILAETKCDHEAKLRCLCRLGFDDFAFVPSIGRSGGLFMAWKTNCIGVEVIRSDRQFIHVRCSAVGVCDFFLTAVYSVPSPSLKDRLWQELKNLSLASEDP
ncbi:hypothetical protein K1719_041511 [Acacia pycnantha]|nr:hypothetical protein K1719_041511 [Acacia pycnantha]